MKHHNYRILLLAALVVGAAFWPARQVKAQQGDTLAISCCDQDGVPIPNKLRDTIIGDTLADGSRAHKVYKLNNGSFYWITDGIDNSGFPLTIVGEKPDPSNPQGNPAVIQMVQREDGTNPAGQIFGGQSSLTLKNLWILGNDNSGNQSNYYEPLDLTGSNNRYIFDGVIFSRSNFAIPAFDGGNNVIKFTNCEFRNLLGKPSTQQWEGRGISVWASQDSIIIENNTFFNIEMTSFQLEGGYANYIRFNHNTIVNQGRQFEDLNKKQEYFTNNLIINGFWHGEGSADYNAPNRPPGQYSTGMFTVGILPSNYGLETERRIVLANNYSWRNPLFSPSGNYADTIRAQPFVSDTSAYFFNTNPHIIAQDTVWMDNVPSGMTQDTYSGALADSMWANITDLRQGSGSATEWFYKLPEKQDGSICYVCVSWPLPEDFSYTDADLMKAGTDGLPIGDLNWFPAQKQTFEANKAQYVKQIEDMAGQKVSFNMTASMEAENGTLDGDASIYVPPGFKSFYMTSGGHIKWTFNLANAGTYKLVVETNMDGNNQRGENIYVNGTNLQNRSGFGEYHFDAANVGSDFNTWANVTITADSLVSGADALTMNAGENTLEIKKSWGYQYFSSVYIEKPDGTVVDTLKPEDATYSDLSAVIEGATYTPSGFQSVELGKNGSSGSISWNVDSLADGSYLGNIFYQAPNGNGTAELMVNGATAQSGISLSGNDSTGHNVQTMLFQIKNGQVVTQAGNQSALTLSSSSHVLIDYMQLFKQQVGTPIDRTPQTPNGFALDQNYPNPFNPTTNIRFRIPSASNVQLTVYNVLGQKVATLINNRMSAGVHVVQFNASQLASGLYFYRLKAGNFAMNKKMMLIK